MEPETIDRLTKIENAGREAINLMFLGVFSEDQDANERYLDSIHKMTAHFVQSLDKCIQECNDEYEKNSIISVGISYLQMALNIICRPMEDKTKEAILRMAFPDYDIQITKRQPSNIENKPIVDSQV